MALALFIHPAVLANLASTIRGIASAITTSATSCSRSKASATSSMPLCARAPSGPVTQLELELQAEVDKYVTCLLDNRARGRCVASSSRDRLFGDARYEPDLDGDERDRYRAANDNAHRYAAGSRTRSSRRAGSQRCSQSCAGSIGRVSRRSSRRSRARPRVSSARGPATMDRGPEGAGSQSAGLCEERCRSRAARPTKTPARSPSSRSGTVIDAAGQRPQGRRRSEGRPARGLRWHGRPSSRRGRERARPRVAPARADVRRPQGPLHKQLEDAVLRANRRVHNAARSADRHGMGATLTAVLIRGDRGVHRRGRRLARLPAAQRPAAPDHARPEHGADARRSGRDVRRGCAQGAGQERHPAGGRAWPPTCASRSAGSSCVAATA